MRGKTHCTIGVLSVIQASILFKIPITVFSLMLSAFFSILPDLDESNSVISDILLKKNTSKFLFKFVVYMISLAIFFISLKLNNNFYISSIITFISLIIIEPVPLPQSTTTFILSGSKDTLFLSKFTYSSFIL